MRRACIDIGSNTTRLLVGDCESGRLREVHQQRAFTRLGRGLLGGEAIPEEKIVEVVEVVGGQLDTARALGAEQVIGVATAAIRRAANGAELVEAIANACGLDVEILSGEKEAKLAFAGAVRMLDRRPQGELGVVDVGGGSSELVVGTAPDRVSWCASFGVGSGDLADDFFRSDPPSESELSSARARVQDAMAAVAVPHPLEAFAVGGSATSLLRIAGPLLDAQGFTRSMSLLCAQRASEIALRFSLDRERVRLLPAGLIILQTASELFDRALQVGRGGIREGVLLQAAS